MVDRTCFKTYQFALVICRNFDGKWLAVNETKNRGWWIPGGAVDKGETFEVAAHRETREEAGIEIDIKGVLRVEHSISQGNQARMRVIFFAEPKDEHQKPKCIPDSESLEARWVTLEEFLSFDNIRGYELSEWGEYIENGGEIFPVGVFAREMNAVPKPEKNKSITYAVHSKKQSSKDTKKIEGEESKQEEFKQSDSYKRESTTTTVELFEKLVYSNKEEEVLKFLTENKKFKINQPISEKKLTILHKAIKKGVSIGIIKLLIEAGADITLITRNKRNVFHYAAMRDEPEIMKLLIQALDKSVINFDQKMSTLLQKDSENKQQPQDYCSKQGDQNTAKILKEFILQMALPTETL